MLLGAAFACGLALACALGFLLPAAAATPLPCTAIAASFVVDLAGLGLLLMRLRAAASGGSAWPNLVAWLETLFACAAAFAGVAVAGTHGESARTFLVLWALFAAQTAVLAALHGVCLLMAGRASHWPAQLCLLCAGCAATALFWSREPIQRLGQTHARPAAALTAGVMAFSPPMAVATAWYRESDAARLAEQKPGSRFDLIRGPASYELWVGSYRAVPYPAVLPQRAAGSGLEWGLLAGLLAGALPVLLAADALAVFARGGYKNAASLESDSAS